MKNVALVSLSTVSAMATNLCVYGGEGGGRTSGKPRLSLLENASVCADSISYQSSICFPKVILNNSSTIWSFLKIGL